MNYANKRFEDFRVGDRAEFSKTITADDILGFAEVTGDRHPAHLDPDYARTTRFGAPVAHGMLTASLLSTANALLLGPVFVGDTITATSEVVEILPGRRRLRCRTTCVNQRGETIVAGQAIEQKDPS